MLDSIFPLDILKHLHEQHALPIASLALISHEELVKFAYAAGYEDATREAVRILKGDKDGRSK